MWFKKNDKSVYLLIDRSGSMAGSWPETLGAVNSYIKKLEDDVKVYVAAFDSNGMWNAATLQYNVLRENVTAKTCEEITNKDAIPSGGTPLYDAVGKIADKMIADNPTKAVLVIMTDGEENSSHEYTLDSVKGKLKILEKNDWPTVYLGADFKNVTVYATSTFNVSGSNTYNTTARNRGLVMDTYATKTASYFTSAQNSTASAESMKLTDAEKAKLDAEA